ncbi:hypothetical protein D5F01_LYC10784 [Larimichthys crocea]|uniref:Sushi domain-containing protein n=1 Tax=Larimichthys crocea TaxID=215358 RepID=A0A6G0II48_LARCR|nr:hypothetical protein D5F01_LYC10784 [Larimichthys crocea]
MIASSIHPISTNRLLSGTGAEINVMLTSEQQHNVTEHYTRKVQLSLVMPPDWIMVILSLNNTYDKACFAPTIPNANYTKNQDGWYEEGYKIRITCDTGYEPKNNDATAICTNGTWSSVPVCEKSIFACGRGTEAGTGSTVEGTDRETRPSTRGTSDSGTPSTGGGSSTSSFLNGRDSTPLMTTVNNCGAYPVVPNSVAVKESEYILKYQCNNYYKHDGPETVMCHSDGSWSELPVCKEAFCTLNPGRYVVHGTTVFIEVAATSQQSISGITDNNSQLVDEMNMTREFATGCWTNNKGQV